MNNNENKLIGFSTYIVREEISIERGEYEGITQYYILRGNTLVGQELTEEAATKRASEMTSGTDSRDLKTVTHQRILTRHNGPATVRIN